MIITKRTSQVIMLLVMLPRSALAHVASAEGILCVEKIAGHHVEPLDYGNIPGCTYSSPEIASVGLTEAQAKEQGLDIKVGKFPFSASGKAQASGASDGFIKVIFDAKYGEWLGCHMIGAGVTDMIAEAVLGRKLETTGHESTQGGSPPPDHERGDDGSRCRCLRRGYPPLKNEKAVKLAAFFIFVK